MASIGIEIPDDEKPDSPVGSAITQQQQGIPQDEVTKSPAFAKTLKWLEKPENLMTALVFAGSVIQPKTGNRNTLQTIAQRGLGTLAFRGELTDVRQKQQLEGDEARRRQQIADAEIAHRKEQIGVAKEQVAATRENTQADANTARMMAGLQAGVAGMNDQTRRYLAELDRETALKIAGMEKSLKEAGLNNLFTADDINAANDLYKASLDSDTPLPNLGAAIEQIMRPKLLFMAIQNPQLAPLLNIFEKEMPGATAPVSAPGPSAAKTPPPKKPANYSGVVDKSKIPTPYKGTPYNPGKTTQRPDQNMTFEEYMKQRQ
jgi:hypothetical protein